jgi:pyrin
MPGDKDSRVSAQLRRNASSAGRLQGLCNVALGRRESKKFEVYLPSGKKRPKSLEIPISSGEGELPNPETFLIAEQSRNANSDSAATPRVALEKGSRNPEHSVVLQELAFGSTPSNAPLPGEKKCTASWEESGTGEPETPEALGKVAGGICHKPSNPELLSSSGEEGAQNPEVLASLGMVACKGSPPPEISFYTYVFILLGYLGASWDPFPNLIHVMDPEKCTHGHHTMLCQVSVGSWMDHWKSFFSIHKHKGPRFRN